MINQETGESILTEERIDEIRDRFLKAAQNKEINDNGAIYFIPELLEHIECLENRISTLDDEAQAEADSKAEIERHNMDKHLCKFPYGECNDHET